MEERVTKVLEEALSLPLKGREVVAAHLLRSLGGDPDHGVEEARNREFDETGLDPDAFWQPKTAEELAAEQGIDGPQDLDGLIGDGAELWDTDEEFDEFLRGIEARRRESQEKASGKR